MSILKRLEEDIFSFMSGDCAVLMGDADFCRFFEEAKSIFSGPTPSDVFLNSNKVQYMGADVVSNAVPGTTGWIIGTKEQVEQMRAAVWAHRYYLMFKDTPDGFLYALKEKP